MAIASGGRYIIKELLAILSSKIPASDHILCADLSACASVISDQWEWYSNHVRLELVVLLDTFVKRGMSLVMEVRDAGSVDEILIAFDRIQSFSNKLLSYILRVHSVPFGTTSTLLPSPQISDAHMTSAMSTSATNFNVSNPLNNIVAEESEHCSPPTELLHSTLVVRSSATVDDIKHKSAVNSFEYHTAIRATPETCAPTPSTKPSVSNITIAEASTLPDSLPESPQPTALNTIPRLTGDSADLLFLIPDRFLSPEEKLELS